MGTMKPRPAISAQEHVATAVGNRVVGGLKLLSAGIPKYLRNIVCGQNNQPYAGSWSLGTSDERLCRAQHL